MSQSLVLLAAGMLCDPSAMTVQINPVYGALGCPRPNSMFTEKEDVCFALVVDGLASTGIIDLQTNTALESNGTILHASAMRMRGQIMIPGSSFMSETSIPGNLSPGTYIFRAEVTSPATGAYAKAEHRFSVHPRRFSAINLRIATDFDGNFVEGAHLVVGQSYYLVLDITGFKEQDHTHDVSFRLDALRPDGRPNAGPWRQATSNSIPVGSTREFFTVRGNVRSETAGTFSLRVRLEDRLAQEQLEYLIPVTFHSRFE